MSNTYQHHHMVVHHATEGQYVDADYQLLTSISRECIESFLQGYDKTARMRKKEGVKCLSLVECVDDELLLYIAEYNKEEWSIEGAGEFLQSLGLTDFDHSDVYAVTEDELVTDSPSGKKQLVADENKIDQLLRAYLESKCKYDTVIEAITALKLIRVDMACPDIHSRIGKYDVEFSRWLRRSKSLCIKESKLCRYYAEGVLPETIKSELLSELECDAVTLAGIRSRARELLEEDHKHYIKRLSRIAQPSTSTGAPQPVRPAQPPTIATTPGGGKPSAPPRQPLPPSPIIRPQVQITTPPPSPYTNHLRDRGTCQGCKKCKWTKEHWAECPGNKRKPPVHQTAAVDVVTADTVSTINAVSLLQSPIMIDVKIAGVAYPAMIDTGAAYSCMSRALVNHLTYVTSVLCQPTNERIVAAFGEPVATRLASVEIDIPTSKGIATSCTLTWCFRELPDDKNRKILLGRDMLDELGMIKDNQVVIPIDRLKATTDDDEVLQDESVNMITNVLLTGEAADTGAEDNVVLPDDQRYKLCKVPDDDPYTPMIWDVLKRRHVAFHYDFPSEGSKLKPMPIELSVDKVIHIPARVFPEHKRQQLEDYFAQAEREGLIGPTSSLYSAPVTIAYKKNGDIRPCIDYHVINSLIVPHEYPIPSLHTIWQSHVGNRYFGSSDLRCGFNQMAVEEDCRKYTAFSTQDRHSETNVAWFGMKDTPAYFSEAMDQMLDDLIIAHRFTNYIDDTSFSAIDGAHFVQKLDRYLERIIDWGLRLKPEKCVFGGSYVDMLGFRISEQGRSIIPERVSALKEMKAPRDKSELQMFLGSMVFFQDLIPNLHQIAAPLHDLTRRDVMFEWSDMCDSAFNEIIQLVTADTVLTNPDNDSEVVLRSDASSVGIGGVMLRRKAGEPDKPICFFSHKFSDVQKRWCTFDQEFFAILYCLSRKTYRNVFKSRHFVIEMDHKNLQYLSIHDAELSDKIQRWRSLLLSFDFNIRHIAGATNVVADMLSRYGKAPMKANTLPAKVWACCSVMSAREANEGFWSSLKDYQAAMTDDEAQAYEFNADGYFCTAGGYIVIPKDANELKVTLLGAAHGTPLTGHQGQRRTVDSIHAAGFDWASLSDDVATHVSSCPVCQKTRLHKHTNTTMKDTAVMQVMHTLAVDSMGPFKMDEFGNCYLMVMVDVASRVTRLKATKSTDAVTAADALVSQWISRMPTLPSVIRTDNGPQYANQVIDAVCQMLNIKRHMVMPHEPQGNGVVERANREVLKHLRCLLLDADATATWSQMIPAIEFILNNSVHSAIGMTPNALLYGTVIQNAQDYPRLVLEYDVNQLTGKDAKAYVKNLQDNLLLLYNQAQRIQELTLKKRDEQYNNEEQTEFNVGDFVLLRRQHDDIPTKLQAIWLGPYKIIQLLQPNVFQVQSLFDPELVMGVHHRRLIPFDVRPDVPLELLSNLAERDQGEFMVDYVKGHDGFTRNSVRFHIKWLGYPDASEYNLWEPWTSVEGNEKVIEYIRTKAPELSHLLHNRRRG